MKVSVVLTTYNGMKYLTPLLDSLRNQTRVIDEVLICDDCSTDETREYVDEYIKKNNLHNWEKCWNTENYGWKKNFKEGIQRAKGDVVFPCDQDDIWELNKIERMVSIMEENQNILLLSSDYSPLYEEGGHKVDDYTDAAVTIEKVPFDEHFALIMRPGCVMAISKKLIELTRDLWMDWYPHDAFVWTVANICEGGYLLHEPLIQYRRHNANASTGLQHHVSTQVEAMKRTKSIVEWWLNQNEKLPAEKVNMLKHYLEFIKLRIGFIQNKKIGNWFKSLKFHKFYRSLRQQFGDWYYIFKG